MKTNKQKPTHHQILSQKRMLKILPKHFLDILHRTSEKTLNMLEKKPTQNRQMIYLFLLINVKHLIQYLAFSFFYF